MIRPASAVVLTVLALGASLAAPPSTARAQEAGVTTAARAQEVDATTAGLAWQDGAIQYSQVVNCPSQIQGAPYLEPGIGTYTGFFGDPTAGVPQASTNWTNLHLVVSGLGNPCPGGTYFRPSFSLPPDVDWYKQAPITCYYQGNPMGGDDCPQWSNLLEGQGLNGYDAYVHPGDTTWGVAPGTTIELLLPIWAPVRAVVGETLRVQVQTADGNSNPTLTPQALLYFSAPPVTTTCLGRAVTVDLRAGDVPTSGDDVVIGTAGSDTIAAGGGNDTVCSGGGADVVRGGAGDDMIVGGGGVDHLNGGDGDDQLGGGSGADVLRGEAGRDALSGNRGVDTCTGGAGRDSAASCEVRSSIP